jgi:hypothetical protein
MIDLNILIPTLQTMVGASLTGTDPTSMAQIIVVITIRRSIAFTLELLLVIFVHNLLYFIIKVDYEPILLRAWL